MRNQNKPHEWKDSLKLICTVTLQEQIATAEFTKKVR